MLPSKWESFHKGVRYALTPQTPRQGRLGATIISPGNLGKKYTQSCCHLVHGSTKRASLHPEIVPALRNLHFKLETRGRHNRQTAGAQSDTRCLGLAQCEQQPQHANCLSIGQVCGGSMAEQGSQEGFERG